jgi:hypothetical protein
MAVHGGVRSGTSWRNPLAYYPVMNCASPRRNGNADDGRPNGEQQMTHTNVLDRVRGDATRAEPSLSPIMTRLLGVFLALAVTTAHVADQGGVTAFAFPDWLGWAYRLIEVGGLLVALSLLWRGSARLGWLAGVLVGAGPLVGYLASRTVGVPSDPADVGNWSDWLGTLSLIIEAALITVSIALLWAGRRHPAPYSDGLEPANASVMPAAV